MEKANVFLFRDINNILRDGYKDENPRPKYTDGTPAHTLSVNQVMRKYDLSKGEFPICSLRPIAWKSAIKEIFWIYQDQSNELSVLNEKYGIKYWNDWESKDLPNTIGVRYGATVKKHHLITKLIEGIQSDPYGRRHIMSLWQEEDFKESDGLMPCAFLTMWNVRKTENEEYLDMTLIQRSGDMLVASGAGGVNEVQYAALLMMIARHCNMKPGVFCHFVQNEQIYDRHIEQAEELSNRFLKKESEEFYARLEHRAKHIHPKMVLKETATDFFKMTINDFELLDYEPVKPQLKFELGI